MSENIAGIGEKPTGWTIHLAMGLFVVVVGGGIIYAASHLIDDLAGAPPRTALPYVLLGIALLIALGFEFVNGFHDTANAVATVIYTHSLEPTCRISSTGSSEMIPNATAPVEVSTPMKFHIPDHTTAMLGGIEWV